MKKYGLILFLMLLEGALALPVKVYASDPLPQNQVIFSEIFVGNPSPNAGQEFIEIYNNTAADIDLSGWRVQYASATKTDWNSPFRNIALNGLIKNHDYFLLTSSGYLSDKSNLTFSSALSQSGGHLRILDKAGLLQDQIGWGNAAMPLGIAIPAPASGSSLSRLTNSLGYNLSLDNNTDFAQSLSPTPLLDNIITLPAVEIDDNGSGSAVAQPDTTPPVKVEYAPIQISELLPNPAPPQTDSKDEFVEIYNPNLFDVNLNGYVITTGLNSTYKYAIKNLVLSSQSYFVFHSSDSGITLSNTSGKAQILAPDGTVIDETSPYEKAPSGQAWIFIDGAWGWSATPTPGAENIFTEPTFVKAASTKKIAKTTTVKTTKRKSATPAKSKKKKANKPNIPLASTTTPPDSGAIHPLILASLGSGALLYALYEYRNDLANALYKFHRYRAAGGGFGSSFAAAGYNRAAGRLGRWQNYFRTRLSSWLR